MTSAAERRGSMWGLRQMKAGDSSVIGRVGIEKKTMLEWNND